MKYTLICLTTDGDQILCHGYDSIEQVKREIRERVERANLYRHVRAFMYRRYIVIGTNQGTDSLLIFNENGFPQVDTMIAPIIAAHAHEHNAGNKVIQFTLKHERAE